MGEVDDGIMRERKREERKIWVRCSREHQGGDKGMKCGCG